MKDSKQLLDNLPQKPTSSTSSPTEAGLSKSDKSAIIDAINRIFGEFQLIYHNQFIKAFPTTDKLQYAKQLWLNHLSHLSAEQIIDAAHRAIKESEYLPTIRGLLKFYDNELDAYGLPPAHSAYVEACLAAAPQDRQSYSHPAVYFAGKASDWFFLANQPESKAFPIFEQHYQQLCRQVRQGVVLTMPEIKALSDRIDKPLSAKQQQQALENLRKSLDC